MKTYNLMLHGKKVERPNLNSIFRPNSNFIETNDDLKIIALKDIFDTLVSVYSPSGSNFAVLNWATKTAHLSKDGKSMIEELDPINILGRTFISTIDEAAKFVIDKSGDGTTSVALATCILSEKVMRFIKDQEEAGIKIPRQIIVTILNQLSKVYEEIISEKSLKLNPKEDNKNSEIYNTLINLTRTSMNNTREYDDLFTDIINYIIDNKIEARDLSFSYQEEYCEGGLSVEYSKGYLLQGPRYGGNKPFSDPNCRVIFCDDGMTEASHYDNWYNFCFILAQLLVQSNSTALMFLTQGVNAVETYIGKLQSNWDKLRVSNPNLPDFPIRFSNVIVNMSDKNYLPSDLGTILDSDLNISFNPDNRELYSFSIPLNMDDDNVRNRIASEFASILQSIHGTQITYNGYNYCIYPSNQIKLNELKSRLEKEKKEINNSEAPQSKEIDKRIENLTSQWVDIKIQYPAAHECTRIRTQIDDAVHALKNGLNGGFMSGGNTWMVKYNHLFSDYMEEIIVKTIPAKRFEYLVVSLNDLLVDTYKDLVEIIVGQENINSVINTLTKNPNPLYGYNCITEEFGNEIIEPADTSRAVLKASILATTSIISIKRIKSSDMTDITHMATLVDNGYNLEKHFENINK